MGNALKDFVNARTAGKALLVNRKVSIGIKKKQILSQGKLLVTQEIAKNHPCNSDRSAKPRCCVFIPNPLSKLFFIYSFLFIPNF